MKSVLSSRHATTHGQGVFQQPNCVLLQPTWAMMFSVARWCFLQPYGVFCTPKMSFCNPMVFNATPSGLHKNTIWVAHLETARLLKTPHGCPNKPCPKLLKVTPDHGAPLLDNKELKAHCVRGAPKVHFPCFGLNILNLFLTSH